jgi:hypothetical protein
MCNGFGGVHYAKYCSVYRYIASPSRNATATTVLKLKLLPPNPKLRSKSMDCTWWQNIRVHALCFYTDHKMPLSGVKLRTLRTCDAVQWLLTATAGTGTPTWPRDDASITRSVASVLTWPSIRLMSRLLDSSLLQCAMRLCFRRHWRSTAMGHNVWYTAQYVSRMNKCFLSSILCFQWN